MTCVACRTEIPDGVGHAWTRQGAFCRDCGLREALAILSGEPRPRDRYDLAIAALRVALAEERR